MYKTARKKTGMSIEHAADALHIGYRTLVNYEQGHTTIPPEIVLEMSRVYNQPAICAKHCSENCPIGQVYAHSVEEKCLTENVLTLLKELNDIKGAKDELIEIAADGKIDSDEKQAWDRIMKELDDVARVIERIKWQARTWAKQKPAQAVAEKRVNYKRKAAL